jgi:ribosomal protein L7Ae-like RNA K-turn-binding protein
MTGPDRVLGLMGLAARAGGIVSGVERVREAARQGRLRYVVLARDASANSREKLFPLLLATRVPMADRFDRAELGDAVGRGPVSAVGVTDATFAARIRALIETVPDRSANTGG